MKFHKKYVLFSFATFAVSLAIFGLLGGKASAATLTVSSGCTLNDAMGAINSAQDENGCSNGANDAYGTNDTVNLPAGTITLSADLPQITVGTNLKVSGAGKSQTTIDANGHVGFSTNDQTAADRTFEKFKITGATDHAINIGRSKNATFDQLEVVNSASGIRAKAVTISVTDSFVHDNTSTSATKVGLDLNTFAGTSADTPSVTITDTKVSNNTGVQCTGIYVEASADAAAGLVLVMQRNTVTNNHSQEVSGIQVNYQSNPALTDLKIDAVTVANNGTHPLVAGDDKIFNPAYISGFILGVSNLKPQLNLTNVTVANNTSVNTVDQHATIAGFFGLLINAPEKINLTNSTVVGNSAEQTTLGQVGTYPAFFLVAPTVSGNGDVTSVIPGGSAENSLIANNTFNGVNNSCQPGLSGALFDINQTFDLTPMNLGHNLSDDAKCTGYTFVANLYDTIEHQVADNGGSVPTIKLLPGSPAINAGGQVQGISTDARGVARSGYYSVGAYQGELLAAKTTAAASGTLGKTGAATVSAIVVGAILLVVLGYTYMDYLRHRKPLVQADPFARQTYTYRHHISTVTIPLLKYRVHISFNRNPSGITKF